MEVQSLAAFGFAPALAATLLHSLWQDALLALAAGLTLRAMTRASAAARHNVATAFLLAMVLAPALQFLLFWRQPEALIDSNLLPVIAAANLLAPYSAPASAAVTLLWLLGVGLVLTRHAVGLRAIAVMERGPHQDLPPIWRQRVDELSRAFGITRAVAVRVTDEVIAPCTARLLRPVIWLPLSLLMRAPAAQVEALLAHELAHIARMDWLWNAVQCAIESVLFFHPAVWWLSRRVRQEREHACDDSAVAASGDAVALAEALAALEGERRAVPCLALAANGGALLQRVTRLLSGPQSRSRGRMLAALSALMLLGVVFVAELAAAGARAPDLVLESSTTGALRHGDYRQLTANEDGVERVYRASIDADGRLTETYREGGQVVVIDADARKWLFDVTGQAVPILPLAPLSDDPHGVTSN